MKPTTIIAASLSLIALAVGSSWAVLQSGDSSTTDACTAWLKTLTEDQREKVVFQEFGAEERLDWHFIPKDERKGLQIKHMSEPQRKAALALLRSTLSQVGYDKAVKIMQLEAVLHALEAERGTNRNIRDPERYYFTVFGDPMGDDRWGLSIEGHHLSLNFVLQQDKVVASTPTFFAANPAIIKNEVKDGLKKGTRVLAQEEQLAFDLVNALTEEQRDVAIIADTAPREIRAAGEPQPPQEEAVGVTYGELDEDQKETMKRLVFAYARNMTREVGQKRIDEIVAAGPENVRFAWAGPTKPGIGHYYRIQGPTFLIEFVNTQPDPAGNPANHIHCVWRDMRGDFAIPIGE